MCFSLQKILRPALILTVLLAVGGMSCSVKDDDEGGGTASTVDDSSTEPTETTETTETTEPPEPTTGHELLGIAFGPFVDGGDPDRGDTIDASTVLSLMRVLADSGANVRWLRTYGATGGLENVTAFAHSNGFKLAQGIWIDGNATTNNREIDAALEAAAAGEVDALIVGSEALLRGDITEAELIGLIERVKAEVPEIDVTYADTYDVYFDRPALVDAVDVICAHFHGYWDGHAVEEEAIAALDRAYRALDDLSEKPVWVCEAGWPSDGSTNANAVPSAENAEHYLKAFLGWAEPRGVHYFYFEAFDEPWKARLEGDVGDHWGLWDQNLNLKELARGALLEGARQPYAALEDPVEQPDEPTIALSFVPPIGSREDLYGHVLGIDPTQHALAIYIRVAGRWWTKPTFARPLTLLSGIDGSFRADITTGGIDEQATEIALFLLLHDAEAPAEPPQARGATELPPELDTLAVATLRITR